MRRWKKRRNWHEPSEWRMWSPDRIAQVQASLGLPAPRTFQGMLDQSTQLYVPATAPALPSDPVQLDIEYAAKRWGLIGLVHGVDRP